MAGSAYSPPDHYLVDELLTKEHLIIRSAIRDWVDRSVKPIIEEASQQHSFPIHLVREMGEMGVLGPFIPQEYGGAGLDQIAYGVIMTELERGDSGIRSAASVQSSLVMYPIFRFGSEEQRRNYLPKLATGEMIGAFGLTEPDYGSDPGGMITRVEEKEDHFLLNGAKMWITNASICDIAVVWAKDETGEVRGLIVERGMEGFTAPETHRKWSLRASVTGELVFNDVRIPKENIFPHVYGLKGPLMCLNSARYGIAWGAIGAALDCYDTAVRYARERKQFKKPIAAFQLTQKKLAEMLTEITKAQLLSLQLGRLKDAGTMTPQQVSLAKRNNVNIACECAREARRLLGGNGILVEYHSMRHLANLESVYTYEGTHDMHSLILGQEVTGLSAF
jgi:glutaryl-CoA dehydrogenase